MNILVLDVAATTSGALTILEQYYYELQADTKNHYYFCISTPELKSTGNITVLKFPWVKKSWLHRLWFEIFCVNRLVSRNKISRVFSLENLILCNPKCEQWVYLHQSLPFVSVKFHFFSQPKMWVYQNIIGTLICNSMKKANLIIVQGGWLMDAISKKCDIPHERFEVACPSINELLIKEYVGNVETCRTLFYPAMPFRYKNHMLILKAMQILKCQGKLGSIKLLLTINGSENREATNLATYIKDYELPVKLLGTVCPQDIFEQYAKSILVFPSYIESAGLPLLEARMSKSPILASNCAFAQELLAGYDKALFFDPFDEMELAELILQVTKN